MTPLDDQLRQTLSERASLLAPSPDPLAGVEARATRIRRRRATAAALGAAAAVAAVALAVPGLVPGRDNAPQPAATPSPTAVTQSDAVLDPDHPWAFRGTPLSSGTLSTFQQEWTARHPAGGRLTPLWSQVYEPSATAETVFVASGSDGARYGVVQSTESGPDFVVDLPLPDGTTALQLALPGDEVARLVVVAAPVVTGFEYASDGLAYQAMTRLADGIAITPLEGEQSVDRLRVTGPDGVVYEGEALEPVAEETEPANLLDWPARGDMSLGPSEEDLKRAFARQTAGDDRPAHYRALFAGDTDSGVRFTVGQAWLDGETRVTTITYATGTTKGSVLTQHGFTPDAPKVLAGLVRDLPGTTTDLLVVVPRPGAGKVSYAAEPTAAFRPANQWLAFLHGVALVDRAKDATADRLEVLDGDGDLDHPLYRGPVTTLLAGDPVH